MIANSYSTAGTNWTVATAKKGTTINVYYPQKVYFLI